MPWRKITVSAPSMYYIYSTVLKHNDKLAVEHIQQGGIKRIYAGNWWNIAALVFEYLNMLVNRAHERTMWSPFYLYILQNTYSLGYFKKV
jgi:hypothetical protein